MKTRCIRAAAVLVLLLATLLVVSTALAQGPIQNLLNGSSTGESVTAPSGAIGCLIEDSNLVWTPTVHVRGDSYGDDTYYAYFDNTITPKKVTTVTFTFKPAFKGSPLATQKQVFHPNSSESFWTPFGIPYWPSHTTAGAWKLIVTDNLGRKATCDFIVVDP